MTVFQTICAVMFGLGVGFAFGVISSLERIADALDRISAHLNRPEPAKTEQPAHWLYGTKIP